MSENRSKKYSEKFPIELKMIFKDVPRDDID